MSYSFWTWASIAILVFGAPGIFIWFLTDIPSLLEDIRGPREPVENYAEIPINQDLHVKVEKAS